MNTLHQKIFMLGIALVNLILALERRFNLRFSLGELDSMRSIGAIIDVIKNKMEM